MTDYTSLQRTIDARHGKAIDSDAKPKVMSLGRCVVERDGPGYVVMFPDGSVKVFMAYAKASEAIKKYYAKRTPKDAIGVGEIVSYDGSITKVTI